MQTQFESSDLSLSATACAKNLCGPQASNSASGILRKAFEYLDAGSRLVWIVDPSSATVTVFRGRDDIRVLGAGETLDATAAIPDLVVDVSELFG